MAPRMSWHHVARFDVESASKQRVVWAAGGLVAGAVALAALVYPTLPGTNPLAPETTGFLATIRGPIAVVVPLWAVGIASRSIVADRASGRLALVLALPHRRAAVVVGKAVSHGLVVGGALVGGFLVAAVVIFPRYATLPVGSYVAFVALSALFVVAFVAVGVGVSAGSRHGTNAAAGSMFLYVLFVFGFWTHLPRLVHVLATGSGSFGTVPTWVRVFRLCNPETAYLRATAAFALPGESVTPVVSGVGAGWPALAVLALWIALPLAAGWARFARADL